jgi:hypothetical protein
MMENAHHAQATQSLVMKNVTVIKIIIGVMKEEHVIMYHHAQTMVKSILINLIENGNVSAPLATDGVKIDMHVTIYQSAQPIHNLNTTQNQVNSNVNVITITIKIF